MGEGGLKQLLEGELESSRGDEEGAGLTGTLLQARLHKGLEAGELAVEE